MARTAAQRHRDEELVEKALLGQLLPSHGQRIHTKVVGVMHHNADGSSRQDAIAKLIQFDQVDLVRNPEDEYDRNAIKVIAAIEGRQIQIGHIDKDLAWKIAPKMDAGEKWRAIVTRVGTHISKGASLMLFDALEP
jgi:hypothetical protein